jgi:hypothetical protein
MTSSQRTLLGIGLFAVGAILLLSAAWIGWSAVQRWMAVAETRDALAMMRRERMPEARKLAARASARVPDEPAPALLAVDPSDLDAIDRLEPLALRGERHEDRQAVRATIALARAAKGKPAGIDLEGAADGRLIATVEAVNAGRDPGRLKSADGEEPPHLNVLRAVHGMLLRRAWQAGKVSEVRAHAGALLLLRPRSADAPLMRLLVGAGSPLLPDAEAVRLMEALKQDQEAVIHAVAALLPQRRAAIAATWPKAVEGLP